MRTDKTTAKLCGSTSTQEPKTGQGNKRKKRVKVLECLSQSLNLHCVEKVCKEGLESLFQEDWAKKNPS